MGLVTLVTSTFYSFRNTDINLNTKKSISIVLSSKPSAHHFSTSLKFYDDVRFTVEGYRDIFIIEKFEYKAALRDEIVRNLNSGDTVKVWIDKTSQKNGNISVYGLTHNGIDYVNIAGRNSIKSRYSKYGLLVTLYGLFLLVNVFLKRGIKLTITKAVIFLLLILLGIYRITK